MIAIRSSSDVQYPDGAESFSPDARYPEYRFEALAARPNPVYRMVRQLLRDAGLDRERFGSSTWNPFGDFVRPGSQVFVLCNFVYHQRPQERQLDFFAKCTHGSVLRAVCDYLLLAVGDDGRVLFGNAPSQSCVWERVLAETGAQRALDFYRAVGARVEARDLRHFVVKRSFLGRHTASETRGDEGKVVEINLGEESFLSEIARESERPPVFRVSGYDPDRTAAFHEGRSHRYLIHRDILESDVVLSLPKLKVHQKVGVTCALKGFVGTVAHKDCLAHHRFGSPTIGGDEYPEAYGFLHLLSRYHDWLFRRSPSAPLQGLAMIVDRVVRTLVSRAGLDIVGAWHGNDTAWRMALDLARIVHHADADGTMHETPVRTHLSLIDGIVAGEAEGPLAPHPRAAGTLIWSDDSGWGDRVACGVMGWPYQKVPLLRRAFDKTRWALPAAGAPQPTILHNGEPVAEERLAALVPPRFQPPRGWRSHLDSA